MNANLISSARALLGDTSEPANTRERFVDCAVDLFYERGIHDVGLDSVLKRVRTTKTTFYKYFDSKDELVFEAIQLRNRLELQAFRAAIERSADSSSRNPVLAVFDLLNSWFTNEAFQHMSFVNPSAQFLSTHSSIDQLNVEHSQALHELLVKHLDGRTEREANELADELMLLMGGAIMTRHSTGDRNAAVTARRLAALSIRRSFASPERSEE